MAERKILKSGEFLVSETESERGIHSEEFNEEQQ